LGVAKTPKATLTIGEKGGFLHVQFRQTEERLDVGPNKSTQRSEQPCSHEGRKPQYVKQHLQERAVQPWMTQNKKILRNGNNLPEDARTPQHLYDMGGKE